MLVLLNNKPTNNIRTQLHYVFMQIHVSTLQLQVFFIVMVTVKYSLGDFPHFFIAWNRLIQHCSLGIWFQNLYDNIIKIVKQHIEKQYIQTYSNVNYHQHRKKWTTFTYVGKEFNRTTKFLNKQDLGGRMKPKTTSEGSYKETQI
jgi:hypothetical protein